MIPPVLNSANTTRTVTDAYNNLLIKRINGSTCNLLLVPLVIHGYSLRPHNDLTPLFTELNTKTHLDVMDFDSTKQICFSFFTNFTNNNIQLNTLTNTDVFTELTNKNAIKELFAVVNRNLGVEYRLFQNKVTPHHIVLIRDLPYGDEHDRGTSLVIGLLPVLFPELQKELTPLEINYFKTIVAHTQLKRPNKTDEINNLLESIITQEYVQEVLRGQQRKKWSMLLQDALINPETTERKIKELENAIKNLDTDLKRYYEEIQKEKTELFLRHSNKDNLKDIADYFINSTYIKQLDFSGSGNKYLDVRIEAPLDFIDEEMLDIYVNKTIKDDGPLVDIYKTLYVENNGYFLATTEFRIDLASKSIGVYRDRLDNNYIRLNKTGINPHHFLYSCLGSYKVDLQKAIQNMDLVLLHDVMVASTRNLNIADSIVMNSFTYNYLHDESTWGIIHLMYKGERMSLAEFKTKRDKERREVAVDETILD